MSTFTGIAPATLTAWLTEAQEAFHALNVGQQAVSIGTGDKRLAFTAADVDKLRAYIADLQRALAIASGQPDTRGRPAVARWTR
jgi:hypothetical protein